MGCLHCGSAAVTTNVRAVENSESYFADDLSLKVYKNPTAIFKGAETFPMRANVCAKCGFVVLFVSPNAARRIRAVHHAAHRSIGRTEQV